MAQDEKFDLEKYLQMLAAADQSEAPAREESTTNAPEQGETEKQGLLERLRRWVRRRASARASAPITDETQNVDVSSNTPDTSSEAPRRTRAQAAPPQEQHYNRTNTPDSGGAAVSAAQQPKRANALPSAAPPDPPYAPDQPVTYASEQDAPPYEIDAPVADAAKPVDTSRTEGESAPSVRAPTPPDTSSAVERLDTPDTESAPDTPRTHAQPATSPPQQPATPTTSYRGEVAGGSVAPRPNRAPSAPQPRPTLHLLTRALDRELRRYG